MISMSSRKILSAKMISPDHSIVLASEGDFLTIKLQKLFGHFLDRLGFSFALSSQQHLSILAYSAKLAYSYFGT